MKKIILALLVAVVVMGASLYTVKAKKVKVKKNYKKVYNFTIQGDCSNADADIVYDESDPDEHSLYRKIAIPSIRVSNMPKAEIYHKFSPLSSSYSGEMWTPYSAGFFTDGFVWIRYVTYDGSDDPGQNCPKSYDLGEFKLFVY